MVWAPIISLGQVEVLNPNNGIALRYQKGQVNQNKILLSTYQPYFVELDARDLSLIRTLPTNGSFRPKEFHQLDDSLFYTWASPASIPLGGFSAVHISRNGGRDWRIHPKLFCYSGRLHFIDSNFIVDGDLFLERYTTNAGQTYQQVPASVFQMAGRHDSGFYLFKVHSDSLFSLHQNGISFEAKFDTIFNNLRHLHKLSNGFVAISDTGDVIHLDANFQYLSNPYSIPLFPFSPTQFFANNDTLALVFANQVRYSTDAGQSWKSRENPALRPTGDLECLGLAHHNLLFANGAGGLAILDLKEDSVKFHGGNNFPSLSQLLPYQSGFYGLEWNNHHVPGLAKYHLHHIDRDGQSTNKVALPFLGSAVGPQISFADSLNGKILIRDSTFVTSDAGQSWTTYPNPSGIVSMLLRRSKDNNCLYAYEFDNSGSYIASIGTTGQRQKMNFIFGTNEKVVDLCFWNCDTGLVISNADVYRTEDGGQTFTPLNEGYIPLWRTQWKMDTLFIASRDFNYFILQSSNALTKIDSQPVLTAFNTSFAYHFITKNKVLSYKGENSKLVIADKSQAFYKELDLPVDQVRNFFSLEDEIFAMAQGGALLKIGVDSLFEGLSKEELLSEAVMVDLWPNPIRDHFFVEGFEAEGFMIIDQFGREVYRAKFNNPSRLDPLKPGFYILVLIDKNQNECRFKIQINPD